MLKRGCRTCALTEWSWAPTGKAAVCNFSFFQMNSTVKEMHRASSENGGQMHQVSAVACIPLTMCTDWPVLIFLMICPALHRQTLLYFAFCR